MPATYTQATGLCNMFLSNGSVRTPTTIGVLLKTVFSTRVVQNGFKEEFSWESAVEFRSSKWAVSQELGSARQAEKMALWVHVWIVNQRVTVWPRKLKNLHCVKSVVRKRLVETDKLRTLVYVCQWSVKFSYEWCTSIQMVNKSIHQPIPPSIVTHP
jgi:hypothetical protein